MSLSLRYLISRPEGFESMSLALMRRFCDARRPAKVPEFAGKRLRYVEGIVDKGPRRAPELVRLTFGTLRFDEEGNLDEDERLRALHVKMKLAYGGSDRQVTGNVIDARDAFLLAGSTWQPTTTELGVITAIFRSELPAKRFKGATYPRARARLAASRDALSYP